MNLKKLFLAFCFAFLSLGLIAQDNPVYWSSKVVNVEGNIYEIQFKASIDGD